jgi:WD40 repeat protein
VWDLNLKKCLHTLKGHSDTIHCLYVSPDDARAVSGSSDDFLKVWDLNQGKCLRTLEGHAAQVYALSVSSDGTKIISGSIDGSLKEWDLAPSPKELIDQLCRRILQEDATATEELEQFPPFIQKAVKERLSTNHPT